jgi:cytochrome c biogenesis factor
MNFVTKSNIAVIAALILLAVAGCGESKKERELRLKVAESQIINDFRLKLEKIRIKYEKNEQDIEFKCKETIQNAQFIPEDYKRHKAEALAKSDEQYQKDMNQAWRELEETKIQNERDVKLSQLKTSPQNIKNKP